VNPCAASTCQQTADHLPSLRPLPLLLLPLLLLYVQVFEKLGPSLFDFLRLNNYQPFPLAFVQVKVAKGLGGHG
jgi:hypothetical protein